MYMGSILAEVVYPPLILVVFPLHLVFLRSAMDVGPLFYAGVTLAQMNELEGWVTN